MRLPASMLGLVACALAVSPHAHAQRAEPAAARFAPPADTLSLPGVESADVPPHLTWTLGGTTALSHNLLMKGQAPPWGARTGVVGWRSEVHVSGSLALWDTVLLGMTMPGAVQVGTAGDLRPDVRSWNTLQPLGAMDARAHGRFRLLRQDRHGVNASLGLAWTLPTSLGMGHMGYPWPTLQPAVLLGRDVLGARLMLNGGLHLRGTQVLGTQVFSDEAFVRAGAAYDVDRLLPAVHLQPYVQASLAANLAPQGAVRVDLAEAWRGPLAGDVGVGLRMQPLPFLQLFGGVDVGVLPAPGVPAWRALMGIRFVRPGGDRDGDGVVDADDACVDRAEDRDGYSDLDGCPDPDNDVDGVPDKADRCPNWSEDLDGFEDADGCPDSDNDGDGVPDPLDACPLVPGEEDQLGCPPAPVAADCAQHAPSYNALPCQPAPPRGTRATVEATP